MSSNTIRRVVVPTLALLFAPAAAFAQQQRTLTAADYARAERRSHRRRRRSCTATGVRPTWLANDRFWYRTTTPDRRGVRRRRSGEGHSRSRLRPGEASQPASRPRRARRIQRTQLPFQTVRVHVRTARFACASASARYDCNPADGTLRRGDGRSRSRRHARARPRSSTAAARPRFVARRQARRVHPRLQSLGARRRDGQGDSSSRPTASKSFGYATDNAGWTHSDRPILVWSPDSKKIATFQQDERGVGEMYLVSTQSDIPSSRRGRIRCRATASSRRSSASSSTSTTAKVIRFQMPADQHRSTLCDDISCRGGDWTDVQWYPDGSHVAFVSTSRDHKNETLRIADATHRRHSRRVGGDGAHAVRVGQRHGELARAARLERGDLVLGARRLGPALSLRSHDRQS